MRLHERLAQLIVCDSEVRVHLHGFSTLPYRFFIAASDEKNVRHIRANNQGEGIQAFRSSHLCDGFASPPQYDQMPGIPLVSCGVIRAKVDGLPVLPLRGPPIPIEE